MTLGEEIENYIIDTFDITVLETTVIDYGLPYCMVFLLVEDFEEPDFFLGMKMSENYMFTIKEVQRSINGDVFIAIYRIGIK